MPTTTKQGRTTPTYLHIYRASYQAGDLWRQSLEELDIPDPEQWGWKTDSKGDFQPLWTTSQSSVTVTNFIETC